MTMLRAPGWRTVAARAWCMGRWLPSLLLLLPWLVTPLSPNSADRILQVTGPDSFPLLDWETQHVAQQFGRIVGGLVSPASTQATDPALVQRYFQTPEDQRTAERPAAEAAIERTIASVYQANGVTRATPFGDRVFPPFIISLSPPPNILIVAPRTALIIQQSVMLGTDLDVPDQEALEQSTESLGVSALVTPIGGIGASYPSMILEDVSARVTLQRAAHEWVHQYLFFSPLGQAYWRSQQAREINESAADLVSVEVGNRAFDLLGLQDAPPLLQSPEPRSAFDFRGFMQATRARVEQLLATGQIDRAEGYMRARRDVLNRHGYAIRKINQAFFAFYGSFADGFGASPSDPTAALLQQLRARSPTLGAFLATLQHVTTLDELRAAAGD